ncbi:hypothetical protein [Streptomyces anulatus]|uniref:hypothetical protein n=1 Tax=Streptomyces anulatus TaxID=1892 RepID=UPI0036CD0AA4
MYETAADDAERDRIRAELYAPPKGAPAARQVPRGGRASRAEAEALMARLEAEDAAFSSGR